MLHGCGVNLRNKLVSQEEELRTSGDPKHAHLEEDLHVLIEVEAPPGQAHARLGLAIEEIKKFLVPVSTCTVCYEYWQTCNTSSTIC